MVTPEMRERLKNNLTFDSNPNIVGVITLGVLNEESRESMEELASILKLFIGEEHV